MRNRVPRRTSTGRKRRPARETYWYIDHRYLFDVTAAIGLVADGRAPVEVEPDDVRYSVRISELNEEHVPHVDHRRPGIIAHVQHLTDDGELLCGHVLIDGHHRAARCLELGLPFRAYILSIEESLDVLLRCPHDKHLVREKLALAHV